MKEGVHRGLGMASESHHPSSSSLMVELPYIHPSLASLPKSCSSWDVYPEDIFPGGSYIDTMLGKVRYWLFGPETGEKIVLIHGAAIPSISWKDVGPDLVTRGYRVLAYDLYGRGYSEAPETTYNNEVYINQLATLLEHVGWNKTHLMGLSMGGGISVAFVARYPQLVDKVILIAPSGLLKASSPKEIALPNRNHTYQPCPGAVMQDPIQEIMRLQAFHLPGYNYALASSFQNGPVHSLAPAFQSCGFEGKEVLFFHGTQDYIIPYKLAAEMQALLPASAREKSHLVTIPGAPHGLTLSHPMIITDMSDQFLRHRSSSFYRDT